MGYRSSVALSTTKDGLEKVREAWNEADVKYYVSLDADADVIALGEEHGDGFVIVWEDVKWSSGYPEVAAVELLVQDEEGFGEPYCFVRIGEEMGDYEHYYSVGEGLECPEELMLYPEMFIEIFDGCRRRMLAPHLEDPNSMRYPLDKDGVPCRIGDWVRYASDDRFEAPRYRVVAIGDGTVCYIADGDSLPTGFALAGALRHDRELTPRRFLEWFANVVTTVSSPEEAEELYSKAENAMREVQM